MLLTPAAAEILLGAPLATVAMRTRGSRGTGTPVSGSPAHHWVPVPHLARNVVGIVPGSDPKLSSTYVSLTAHNDHVGVCGPGVDHDSLRAFNRVYRSAGVDSRGPVRIQPDSDAKVRHIL